MAAVVKPSAKARLRLKTKPASSSPKETAADKDFNVRIVDKVINQLMTGKDLGHGRDIPLRHLVDDIFEILHKAKTIVLKQPMLLELNAPVTIVGDIHGQYKDLLRLFEMGGWPPKTNYLFLGDYVDRSLQSVEVITLLMCYKVKYPYNFFLLMGNHEDPKVNCLYGFQQECRDKFDPGLKLWKEFNDVFKRLPLAAVVADKIFCAHGGISEQLIECNIDIINDIKRPVEVEDSGLLCDILWSDPRSQVEGFKFNIVRAVSYYFGFDKVNEFLENNGLEMICRAHECVQNGYEFQADMKVLTLFSAPNYNTEFDNAAAIMEVDENLKCRFHILEPHRTQLMM